MESCAFLENSEVVGVLDRLKTRCAGKVLSDIVDAEGHQYVDFVMEGGGVLGVALVGYTYVLEQMGIRFLGVGGTSAGAINALLVAAAGPPQEAKSERTIPHLADLDCHTFVDGGCHIQRFIDDWIREGVNFSLAPSLPWVLGHLKNDLGLNPGLDFLNWLSGVLRSFNIVTYRDLRERMNRRPEGLRHREGKPLPDEQAEAHLAVVATEIVTETKVEFPEMAGLFWIKPDELDPALFVRASMSIPYFFQPLVLDDIPRGSEARELWSTLAGFDGPIPERCMMVDGGVMSNFPIDLVHLPDQVPAAPTFGVKLGLEERHNEIKTPIALGWAVLNSARHCLDYDFLRRNPDYRHLVAWIDTGQHQWLNFDMTEDEKIDLFLCGVRAAAGFLEGFDWAGYKAIRADLVKVYAQPDGPPSHRIPWAGQLEVRKVTATKTGEYR
jgi:NTE family protein